METAKTPLNALEILKTARKLTKAEIWEALPEDARSSAAIKEELTNAGPKLAASIYKDCFWKFDESQGKMVRLMEEEKLLPFLVGIYLQKGGEEPEAELQMWARIFKLDDGASEPAE